MNSKSYPLTNKESYYMKNGNDFNKQNVIFLKFGSNNYSHYKIVSASKSSKNLTLIVYYT